uniref:Uncharacterized protein n=1 Tax=Oryza glumipatula TaxID=40148 RepID=A0A0E0AI78_9ORYZ
MNPYLRKKEVHLPRYLDPPANHPPSPPRAAGASPSRTGAIENEKRGRARSRERSAREKPRQKSKRRRCGLRGGRRPTATGRAPVGVGLLKVGRSSRQGVGAGLGRAARCAAAQQRPATRCGRAVRRRGAEARRGGGRPGRGRQAQAQCRAQAFGSERLRARHRQGGEQSKKMDRKRKGKALASQKRFEEFLEPGLCKRNYS